MKIRNRCQSVVTAIGTHVAKRFQAIVLSGLFVLSTAALAQGSEWVPITGAETLRKFMSGTKVERKLPSGDLSRGEYHPDGTGTLYSWGASIPRTWEVKGDEQVCITVERVTWRYQFERNSADPDLYRARDVTSDEWVEFRVTDGRAIVVDEPKKMSNKGGAAAPSSAEIAAELSNPNTAVATLNFKNQFRWFEGDLPDADDQWSYTLLFQPVLPFVLGSGDKIIWRPAVPLVIDQPVFEPSKNGFRGESGLGDIVFDLAYAPKLDSGLLFAAGLIASLPTATDDALGTDRWTLGPELLIGKITPSTVIGLFPNHQWDIGGSGDADISLTSIQAFYTYLPGGGWSIGSGPTITYDWEAEQWTVPLQINAGKTIVIGGRPWKLSAELNYYVEKADAFGPQWLLSFNIAPVVKNGLAKWFGLGK
jgi:hypothetical protein